MPELPEVETTCTAIRKHVVNKKITKLIIRQPKLRWEIPKDIAKNLIGKKLLSVIRRGKYIIIQNSSGFLIIHLGMSGKLCITDKTTIPDKHAHIDIIFSNFILRYSDPRRFGCVLWSNNYLEHKLIAHLGVEPLTTEFNYKYFLKKINNKKSCIKLLLMNSKIVVGVGNIYANEALFNAKILPTKEGSKLTTVEIKLLITEVKKVLKLAIKKGGTTLKDFFSGDNKPGYFSQKLKVYGRENEACVDCNNTLQEKKISNRTTVFCNVCQV